MLIKNSIELVRKELIRKELVHPEPSNYSTTNPKYIYVLQGSYSDFDSLPTAEEYPDLATGSYCLFYTAELAMYSELDDSWKVIG